MQSMHLHLCPRILALAPQPFYQERGSPIALSFVIQALTECGYQVDLVTFDGGVDLTYSGVQIYRVRANIAGYRLPIGFSWRKLILNFALTRLARKLIKKNFYCAIHALEESVFFTPLITYGAYKIPVIYDMHSRLSHEIGHYQLGRVQPLQYIFKTIETRTIQRVNRIFCSMGLKDSLLDLCPLVPITEWHFPALTITLAKNESESVRAELGIASQQPIIVYAGNTSRSQNISLLIDTAAEVARHIKDFTILIVGIHLGNPLDKKTLQQAQSLPFIKIIGRQTRDKTLKILASADIAVSLRRDGQNAPLKLFDYIGAGIPVVATDIPAHRCVLGADAVYCKPTPDNLAAALLALLHNPGRMIELRQRYSERRAAEYSWETFRDSLSSAYPPVQKPVLPSPRY